MAKPHPCDVPGCTRSRRRWQRLCDACFRNLPGDIRSGIIEAHRQRDRARHRAERKRAAEYLASAATSERPSPAQTYEATRRLLGERS